MLEVGRYLWRLQLAYQPRPFHGRVHVFVSQFRPTGWLGDSSLGWGRLAREGVEAVAFEGAHWSIFDEPDAGKAAATIAAALEAPSARNLSKAAPSSDRPNGQFPQADPLVSIVIPAYNAAKTSPGRSAAPFRKLIRRSRSLSLTMARTMEPLKPPAKY